MHLPVHLPAHLDLPAKLRLLLGHHPLLMLPPATATALRQRLLLTAPPTLRQRPLLLTWPTTLRQRPTTMRRHRAAHLQGVLVVPLPGVARRLVQIPWISFCATCARKQTAMQV